ncbi:MAG: GH3 auxin-responsive promoter family protein [Cytophagales bacterium]|nr:GH3 auxin-responsive promoter family protein [Cytophagales bacterium]
MIDSFDHSQKLQEDLFFSLINKGSETLFGFDHNFKKIKNLEDFNRYVPVSTYEQIFPYIDSMMRGEQNILWSSKIKWFSKSSGTTNDKSKYIPVSSEGLKQNHYKAGRDMLAIYLHNHPDSELLRGKNLAIVGSISIDKKNFDIKCGDASEILMNNLPIWTRIVSASNLKDNPLSNLETKMEIISEKYSNERVTSITGIPTWTLPLLKMILEQKDIEYMDEIWPSLEVFFHGGVSLSPYKKFFKKLSRRRLNYQEEYNAGEGFFGIQLNPKDNDMILLLNHGIFYEFVELEDFEKNDFTNVKTIKNVEMGKIYALIVTTNSGLWRYVIGDTIEFTCLNPFKIKIVGRTKLFINTFGEELVMQNAEDAIFYACQRTGSLVENYTAGPKYFNDCFRCCHEWAIEFIKAPDDLELFTNCLDEKLQSLNPDFEAKRCKDMVLDKPILKILPKGFFYDWIKRHNKLGGQNKIPRLFNSRKFLDDIPRYL